MPKPATRRAAILEALRKGERMTHIDALNRGWGWRLAADIFALRVLHGWRIESAMIQQQSGNEIAVYWLPAIEATNAGRCCYQCEASEYEAELKGLFCYDMLIPVEPLDRCDNWHRGAPCPN